MTGIFGNRIRVTMRLGEGESERVLEVRRQCDDATRRRVYIAIEQWDKEKNIDGDRIIKVGRPPPCLLVSLSFKEELRECDKVKGVYTVLEARRQCENEIRRRG